MAAKGATVVALRYGEVRVDFTCYWLYFTNENGCIYGISIIFSNRFPPTAASHLILFEETLLSAAKFGRGNPYLPVPTHFPR